MASVFVKTTVGGMVFDAVFREEHTRPARLTDHPVQNGADISDHVILEHAELVLDVGMTDAGMSYGQGGQGRSVRAYEELVKLYEKRQPMSVTTRLDTYKNMIIRSISTPDDATTYSGLKATIELREVLIADVAEGVHVSSDPQKTDSTNRGTVDVTPVSEDQKRQSTMSQGTGSKQTAEEYISQQDLPPGWIEWLTP